MHIIKMNFCDDGEGFPKARNLVPALEVKLWHLPFCVWCYTVFPKSDDF